MNDRIMDVCCGIEKGVCVYVFAACVRSLACGSLELYVQDDVSNIYFFFAKRVVDY